MVGSYLVAGLTLLAVLIRLSAQDSILLYPDSYQFLLVIRGLGEGIPLDAAMGAGGDAWSTPFYRLGYPILAFALHLVLGDAEASPPALSFAAGTADLPKDIGAFVALARDLGWHTPLLEATIEANQRTTEAAGRRPALAESLTSAAS